MRVTLLSLLAAATVVNGQSSTVIPAPMVTGNPVGASYAAMLPVKNSSLVAGSILAVTGASGNNVSFSVSFSGLPTTGGPFIYHIHQYPVPANGNCTGTGAHLDPYMRGETPPCDATMPQTCQLGDLSGKYGNFSTTSFSAQYTDPYLSTRPDSNAFFGNLSFVIHFANKTRIACANFTSTGSSSSSANSSSSAITTTTTPTSSALFTSASPSPTLFFGGATTQKVLGSTNALLVAAAAALML